MTEKSEYIGTPEDVGAQIASDALGPTISEATKTVTDSQVARMMAGMIAFLAGAVSENLGPEVATGMLRGIEENITATTKSKGGMQ